MGVPITVIFVNNAIYGMTGGQMAPTTLMGQTTATSPLGRNRIMGEPLKMAELIAQLDGPMYVERVALFDAKMRTHAKRAIKKAIQLQVEGRGFAFVEVLAECPTHLKMTPQQAEEWVKTCMVPVFPLGIKKDETRESWFKVNPPKFDAALMQKVVGGSQERVERSCYGFPAHIQAHDISLKLAGAGGDGAQTAAMLITRAAINEGFDGTHIPSYGPESRGGTSYADVHVAEGEVLSPASPNPNILIAFNAPSLAKFGPHVARGGIILYDSSVITEAPDFHRDDVKLYGIPFTDIAVDLGKVMVKNVVALGALQAASEIFPAATILTAIRQALKDKCAMIPLNEEAFKWGGISFNDLYKPRRA
jgi:2-oxoisovalerate ferredoxin oxidoreductase beta subunit